MKREYNSDRIYSRSQAYKSKDEVIVFFQNNYKSKEIRIPSSDENAPEIESNILSSGALKIKENFLKIKNECGMQLNTLIKNRVKDAEIKFANDVEVIAKK